MYVTLLIRMCNVLKQYHIAKGVIYYIKDSVWYCDCDYHCCLVLHILNHLLVHQIYYPVGIYMFKVNNRDSRTRCQTCSKLTIKIPDRLQILWNSQENTCVRVPLLQSGSSLINWIANSLSKSSPTMGTLF